MVIDEEKSKAIDTPQYKGPERRMVVEACLCHHKHTRILEDHDKRLDQIMEESKQRRELMSSEHATMYEEMKMIDRSKVSNRLFYLFISVYSLLFIFGIVSVYQGMHKNALTFMQGIAEVKIMQTSTDGKVADLKEQLRELKNDVKTHMSHNGAP